MLKYNKNRNKPLGVKVHCRACCDVRAQCIFKTVFYAAMRPDTPPLPNGSFLFPKAKNNKNHITFFLQLL